MLHRLGWVTGLRTARTEDLKEALEYMHRKNSDGIPPTTDIPWAGDTWDIQQAYEYIGASEGSCVVLINDYFVDVTVYMAEHVRPNTPDTKSSIDQVSTKQPGGAAVLKRYSLRQQQESIVMASWAFDGGLK